ncbi:MAG: sn-glycerol-1-phosphate dehydrogenase [Thermomicrobiales bacterium]
MTDVIDQHIMEQSLAGAKDTRAVAIGRGAIESVDRLYVEQFGDAPALIVADGTTYAIAGRTVAQRLRGRDVALLPAVIFPARPVLTPDVRYARRIADRLAQNEAVPIAVGSGTINDIVKLGAYRAGRSYLSVATAASMDGYAASGGAMVNDGFKQTLACPAPRAILADLDLLAGAPQTMTAAGYADLLGKVTAGADWLVADALGIEPVLPDVWAMVQRPLRDTLSQPELIRVNDPDAIERLVRGLIVAGLAMQAVDSSRPASGAEHQFSHLWEMSGLSINGTPVSHGFKVGVGSLAVAALYERLLARDLAQLDVDRIVAAWPTANEMEQSVRDIHADADTVEPAVAESRAKHPSRDELADRLRHLRAVWPGLRDRLSAQLLPAAELRRMLATAGCPTSPAAIGLSPRQLRETYASARQIRRRYTVLDLAVETGLLADCVAELFAPRGFWARD